VEIKEIPFSAACERNKTPIVEVLKKYISAGPVLEFGHGTGQHAHFFSSELQVNWYPGDVPQNNSMVTLTEKSRGKNPYLQASFPLVLGETPLAEQVQKIRKPSFPYIFSANTLHIIQEKLIEVFCRQIPSLLMPGGYLFLYGPFRFEGQFTSDSNQCFDLELRKRDSTMGIRDFESIRDYLKEHHVTESATYALPAHNHILVFQKEFLLGKT